LTARLGELQKGRLAGEGGSEKRAETELQDGEDGQRRGGSESGGGKVVGSAAGVWGQEQEEGVFPRPQPWKVANVGENVVNLRAEPRTDAEKVGEARAGDILEAVGFSGCWLQVCEYSSEVWCSGARVP